MATSAVNLGVAAHITAASVGGPRFQEDYSEQNRKGIQNGIWLCQNCAKLIDNDATHYTVELLSRWKSISERLAHSALYGNVIPLPLHFVEELITLTEIRAGDVLETMDYLGQKAVTAYRSDHTPEKVTKENQLLETIEHALASQDPAALHRLANQIILRDGPSRWAEYETEASLVGKLEKLKDRFLHLHAKHKTELRKGHFISAHEIVGEIHTLIAEYNRAVNPPYPDFNTAICYFNNLSEDKIARRLVEEHTHYPGVLPPVLMAQLPLDCQRLWLSEDDDRNNLKKAIDLEQDIICPTSEG